MKAAIGKEKKILLARFAPSQHIFIAVCNIWQEITLDFLKPGLY